MELKGDNAFINIDIISKSNPYATNEWDKKWLKVNVVLKLLGFTANFTSEFLIDDFILFLKSIERIINKETIEIEFKTMEDTFYLKGVLNHLGNIEWIGYAVYPVGNGNKLTFKFESEYNQLEYLRDDLSILIGQYES
ncbi:MAG: WapI family immunity protein [Bacteroidales bacterium]